MFALPGAYPAAVTRTRTSAVGALAAMAAAVLAGVALGAPGDLSVASLGSAGASGATAVEAGVVSADGRFVAFTSASDLAGVPVGAVRQLYVRDRVAGTTKLASASAAGAAANAAVDAEDVANLQFAISADGRYVVFAAAATNLTPSDTDAGKDVYRKDMTTGAVTLVSVSSAGVKANAAVAGDPDVSADGSRVSFGTGDATNLFGADANAAGSDIVVRDITAGTTVLAAVNPAGVQANGTTERSAISADGRSVVMEAPAGTTNLAATDTGAANDAYVRNLAAGTTTPASDPAQMTGSGFPDISGDGRYVVFETGFAYDPVNDAGGNNDVYRRDMGTGAIVLVSARNGLDTAGNAGGIRPAISADGTRVAFASTSANLAADSNAAVKDVFVRDVATKATRLASVRADGTTQSNVNDSDRAAIAANGGAVAFVYDDNGAATKLLAAETNNQPDALLKELAPSDAAGPALTLTGPVDGSSQKDAQVAVAGTATDASGVVTVTVNGNSLPLTATGGFSTTALLATGANAIAVVATDGAGNATTRTITVTRLAAKPAKKVLGLSASLVGRRIVVKINLSVQARVRFTVLRRTVGPKPKRLVTLRRVGKPILKVVRAGRRTIKLVPPTRAPGRYVVRVQIVGVAGKATTRTDGFRILPR